MWCSCAGATSFPVYLSHTHKVMMENNLAAEGREEKEICIKGVSNGQKEGDWVKQYRELMLSCCVDVYSWCHSLTNFCFSSWTQTVFYPAMLQGSLGIRAHVWTKDHRLPKGKTSFQ